jgi:hypothetical protein
MWSVDGKLRFIINYIFCSLYCILLLSSCGGEAGSGEGGPSSSRTGSISLELEWEHPQQRLNQRTEGTTHSVINTGPGDVCVDYGIQTVTCLILTSTIEVRKSNGTK